MRNTSEAIVIDLELEAEGALDLVVCVQNRISMSPSWYKV